MRPNNEEVLRGLQQALATFVLPEVQSQYARTELSVTIGLLGIVAGELDGAAQRLVDDNTALRALAGRGAGALAALADGAGLAGELRALAAESDASLLLSSLSAANGRLRDAVGRLGVLLQGRPEPELAALRSAVIDHLWQEAESRAYGLMGPRTDG